ncbi:TonB-dependent receptor [Sphingomonas sp. CFBP 8760]|uniref:TonB-dependent receptor n=1 Tax=Sphingomonas sp. CFBP 8760 TaxID=2775282 RepID=UPI0017815E72|nr:TonB-dependent receptor [Sphingomonas sp. CFBP 8760]MBD8548937.1 TonB-dependent receptor [Sphingomonas sp. CFBP 8760]
MAKAVNSRFGRVLGVSFLLTTGAWHAAAIAQTTAASPTSTDQTTVEQTSIDAPVDAAGSEEIVVTGFRRSLQLANEKKRSADVVSDGISAEDIGKFPDQNLAESLQRITGVQITRSRGEGSSVSIRGLAPDFARTQYNGRTLGSGGSRSFDFTALSAEFVSAVEVAKSPSADMIEGGLAGTINVRTARPLDIGKSSFNGTVEGVYEDNPKKLSPRVAGLANYVNSSKTFGINVGVAYEQRKYLAVSYEGYGAETGVEAQRNPPIDYNRDGDFGDTYTFNHAQAYQAFPGSRKRFSVVGAVQYKPTDNVNVFADYFHSDFRDKGRWYENATRFTNIAPALPGQLYGVTASTIDTTLVPQLLSGSQGFVTAMTATGLDHRASTFSQDSRKILNSYAGGFDVTDGNMKVSGQASYFKSTTRSLNNGFATISRAIGTIRHPDGLGSPPQVTYGAGYDPLDPSTFFLLSQDFFGGRNSDRNYEGRLDAEYTIEDGFLKSLKAGLYYGDRRNTSVDTRSSANAATLARLSGGKLVFAPGVEGAVGAVRATNILKPISFDTKIPYYPASYLVTDLDAYYGIIPYATVIGAVPPRDVSGSGYDVGEQTMAAYVQAGFGSADGRLGGNLGVRFVNTQTVSNGLVPDLNGIIIEPGGVFTTVPTGVPTKVKGDYDYFLPSLNVKYELANDLLVRGALARVLGRPGLGSLSAGTSVNANVRSINSGNPSLQPYLSDQADLSLEYYLPKQGLLSAAVFYKHLTNYIINGQVTQTLTAQLRGGGTQTLVFRRNQPLNLASADIKGAEVAAQIPLAYLGGTFDGFGVFGSFTYIDAPKIPQFQGGPNIPLNGVSKYNYNVGGYFEKYGIGLRGSYTYRSEYSSGDGNYFGDGTFVPAYGQLDGSVSYQLTPAISLSADVTNLLDALQKTENSFGLARIQSQIGRRITAGVHFRF